MQKVFIFLIIVVTVEYSSSFPNGAPASRCDSLTPSHSGTIPQELPSPFEIVPSSNTIKNGEVMKIEIRSSTPGRPFAEFIMQARTMTDPYVIQGEFQNSKFEEETLFILLDCSGSHTTVTQANNSRLESLAFEWTAPREFFGVIRFHATIVENYTTFWVNQASNEVNIVLEAEVPPTTVPSQTDPPNKDFELYEGCGETKTCFGIGSGDCVSSKQCVTFGAVIHDDGKFIFEMRSSQAANYIAFALSNDILMGQDSVIECVNEGGNVRAYTSFTSVQGGYSSPRIENQAIIRLIESRIEDGVIYCQVERDAITTVNTLTFDLVNIKYHLMLASGDSVLPNSIARHNINREASVSSFLLTEFSVVHPRSRLMLYLHASFMITAWIGTTSVGIFVARFLKKTWTDFKIYGREFWFMTHQVVQSLTWLLTLAGFVIIVVDADRWVTSPHTVLGSIAFTLCMIQPIGAAFRPKPRSTARNIFNFIHLASGNVAHLLAVMTIFFAVRLTRAQLPDYFIFILIAFVAFYVTFYTSMTILGFLSAAKDEKIKESTADSTEKPDCDAPFSRAKKTLFIIFVLITVMFVIGLVSATVTVDER